MCKKWYGRNSELAYTNWRDPPYPSAAHGAKLGGMDQQPPQDSPSVDAERKAPRPQHDLGLKRLFSHRRMMADLLRLLPRDLTEGLDRSTLRRPHGVVPLWGDEVRQAQVRLALRQQPLLALTARVCFFGNYILDSPDHYMLCL